MFFRIFFMNFRGKKLGGVPRALARWQVPVFFCAAYKKN